MSVKSVIGLALGVNIVVDPTLWIDGAIPLTPVSHPPLGRKHMPSQVVSPKYEWGLRKCQYFSLQKSYSKSAGSLGLPGKFCIVRAGIQK